MLSVRRLRLTFANGFTALHDVTFDVSAGEVVCVIGRSSAGKSTLLRCINGLQPATAGSVPVDGVDVGAARANGGALRRLQRRRLIASGVTTEFHAIAFMDDRTTERSETAAAERSAFVAAHVASGRAAIDHQVLHRIDVWHPEALDAAFASLKQHRVRYLSLNDHTPGQGQYRNAAALAGRVQRFHGRGLAFGYDLDEDLDDLRRRRGRDTTTVPGVYERQREEVESGEIHVASHDDDSAEKVDALWSIGARVSEFPVTLEAAQRAAERGMAVIVGAPNVVRGGSQSGNLAAREVAERGWEAVLCADYHAPSLLPAIFRLVDEQVLDLPAGIRLATLNPARALQMTDRGEIRAGLRADLIAVRRNHAGLPSVERVWSAGDPIFRFGTR